MALQFANNAKTTLASPITSGATSATLAPGTGALFPPLSGGNTFLATLTDALTESINEIVLVTVLATDTVTITRAQEGTTAQSWLAGDFFSNFITAGTMAALFQSFFPTGTRMAFQQTAAPTGWTKDTTTSGLNDSLMRFTTGSVTSGGSQAFSTWNALTATGAHTLSQGEIPTGLFTFNDPTHRHSSTTYLTVGGTTLFGPNSGSPVSTWFSDYASTGASITDHAGGGSHNHPLTNGLKFFDCIVAVKN